MEDKFQSDFIKSCSKYNWSAYHLSGESGLHDLILLQKDKAFTVELKAVPKAKFNHAIKSMFKSTQMPFYLRQIQESLTPTHIAIKWMDENPFYSCHQLSSTKEIIDFFAMKMVDLIDKSIIDNHIDDLVRRLTGIEK